MEDRWTRHRDTSCHLRQPGRDRSNRRR